MKFLARLLVVLVTSTLLGGLGLTAAASASTASSSAPAASHRTSLHLGDRDRATTQAVHGRTTARSSINRWNLSTITYYDGLPSAWAWSLSRAVASWDAAGADIRFARTTVKSRARLVVSYGATNGSDGMATVGATTHPFVHLSPTWAGVDATDAWNRVAVMEVLAHELGHVLGFEHTTATCALMNATIDIDDCGVLPATAGYYRCRVIDPALQRGLILAYGGRARTPASTWCLIDPAPAAVTSVDVTQDPSSLQVSWTRPSFAPAGSTVQLRVWSADTCTTTVPTDAAAYSLPVSQTSWQDAAPAGTGADTCLTVRAVNRYGVGSGPIARQTARPTS